MEDHLQITPEFLRPKEASRLLGFSRCTLWRLSKSDPTFPKAKKIGPMITLFGRAELLAWAESQGGAAQ